MNKQNGRTSLQPTPQELAYVLLDPSNVGSESKTRIYLVLMIIGSVVMW